VATTQEAQQVSTLALNLTVDDLQKSIKFYEALGFVVDERWEEAGTLLGVTMRAGKNQIGLNQDDWKKGRDRKKGVGVRLFVTTPKVDEVAKRAKSGGIALISEPHDTEWKNSRAFEVADPSGFLLTVISEL
jgi:predicted enzyme related to lactoylglutathione lyase